VSQHDDLRERPEQTPGVGRRGFLLGATGLAAGTVGAALLPSPEAAASTGKIAAGAGRSAGTPDRAPLPKVLRSQRALAGAALTTSLPITQNGTTYEMAQEARWLDGQHFAVGRWDGSMSIFQFETAPYVGPLIARAVNDHAFQGVEMVTSLPGNAIVTSNDGSSIGLFKTSDGNWSHLHFVRKYAYSSSLGFASSGAFAGSTLVLGHTSGYLSIWNYNAGTQTLQFAKSVNVQNPNPTNPWNDHTIEDVVVANAAGTVVAAGSEDGYVTFLSVPSGTVLSQTVFNPGAQRGINAIDIQGDKLLVANCSVGPSDYNTWYYSINQSTWAITLLDKANLIINSSLPQVFNFDVVWGTDNGSPCWFASTEEGALWMGQPSGGSLNPIGYEQLTAPLGSALAYRDGQLVMVAYDLYQFSTS